MSTVNERIREARLASGLSMVKLAQRIDALPLPADHKNTRVTHTYLSKIEAGERIPSVESIRLIAKGTGVSAYWLENGREDPVVEAARKVVEEWASPGPSRVEKAIHQLEDALASVTPSNP